MRVRLMQTLTDIMNGMIPSQKRCRKKSNLNLGIRYLMWTHTKKMESLG